MEINQSKNTGTLDFAMTSCRQFAAPRNSKQKKVHAKDGSAFASPQRSSILGEVIK